MTVVNAQIGIAPHRALDMATARYEEGAATCLDVITAHQLLLDIERQFSAVARAAARDFGLVKALNPGARVGSLPAVPRQVCRSPLRCSGRRRRSCTGQRQKTSYVC